VTVAAHGPRLLRTVLIDRFAVPILTEWLTLRTAYAERGPLLFPKPDGKPFTGASNGNHVRDALLAINAPAADMSPRLLRNTDCRRSRPRRDVQLVHAAEPGGVGIHLGFSTGLRLLALRLEPVVDQALCRL
jgi:hypothetical protein